MEREIVFRGKRINSGQWIMGSFVSYSDYDNDKVHLIYTSNGNPNSVDPSTVGQYTGLTDKYGTKIFEGDVVNFKTSAYFFKNCRINYESQFARFCAIDNKGYEYPMDKTFNYEIIGNVFDNPELLRRDTE